MTKSKAYIICISTGLFFLFGFLQMSLPNSLGMAIKAEYHFSSWQYDLFLSAFFYGTTMMTLPAGFIIDRFPLRITLLTSCGLSILLSIILSVCHAPMLYIACRFMQGAAHSFALLTAIKMITYCFPTNKIGRITGIIVGLGMIGGLLAQAPLFLLYQHCGLHITLLALAIFGVSIWVTITLTTLNIPVHKHIQPSTKYALYHPLVTTLRNPQNWLIALYVTLLNLILMALGASWGQHLLTQHQTLHAESAALITTLLFLGILMGSPILGWLSDRLQTRRWLLALSIIITIMLLIFLTLTTSDIVIAGIIFAIGLCNGSQILGFTHVVASNTRQHTAISTGFISIIIMLGSALILPLLGNTVFTLPILIGMMLLALLALLLSKDII